MIRRFLDALYLVSGWLSGISLVAIFLLMMFMSIGVARPMSVPPSCRG